MALALVLVVFGFMDSGHTSCPINLLIKVLFPLFVVPRIDTFRILDSIGEGDDIFFSRFFPPSNCLLFLPRSFNEVNSDLSKVNFNGLEYEQDSRNISERFPYSVLDI